MPCKDLYLVGGIVVVETCVMLTLLSGVEIVLFKSGSLFGLVMVVLIIASVLGIIVAIAIINDSNELSLLWICF